MIITEKNTRHADLTQFYRDFTGSPRATLFAKEGKKKTMKSNSCPLSEKRVARENLYKSL